nr:LysR family transcriptional regulator [Candidatus Halocynthiibacter alkanivorans]
MNFRQLRAFREVMIAGSISEAARILYRTQPAISSLIADLEKDLGVKLFVRQGARIHPNPEAHFLFDEADAILNRLETVKATMKSISELERGEIRVVSMPGPAAFFLPDLIARFVDGKANIHATLNSRTSRQVQRLIATQQFDVGLADFGFGVADDSRLIHHEHVKFYGLCAVLANDPLANKDVITATDLNDRPLAVADRSHPIHTHIQSAFDKVGAKTNFRFESQYFLSSFTYVERGLACAIVDPFSAQSYKLYSGDANQIVFRPFEPAVEINITIMSPAHRPLSNVAQASVALLTAEAVKLRDKWPGADHT